VKDELHALHSKVAARVVNAYVNIPLLGSESGRLREQAVASWGVTSFHTLARTLEFLESFGVARMLHGDACRSNRDPCFIDNVHCYGETKKE
jgi:hypothetical protein